MSQFDQDETNTMKNIRKIFTVAASGALLALLTLSPTLATAHVPINTNTKPMSTLAPMLAKAAPAVVNISVEKEITAHGKGSKVIAKALAVGSGVIINAKKGYIATNAHIVSDQKVMLVTLKDGRRYRAKLIGQADGFDVAIIQIHAKNLKQMPLANSSKLKVGDFVVAIGSPFGLSQTVTSGVISALNRATPKIEGFQNFIQTDASINPGNSGGALINMSGQLVGMNTAILAPNAGNIGIGFAIPSNMLRDVSQQLIKYGKIKPSILGVIAQNMTPELADALGLKNNNGVVLTQVLEGSPADKAGLKSEDVITKVDDNLVHSAAQLHNLMGIIHPGTKIHITLIRDNKVKNITATVGDPKGKMKHRMIPYLSGIRLQNFSDLEPDSSMVKGTMVLDLTDTSAAALAGLIPGDIIVKADGKNIDSIKQLISVAENSPNQLLLKVVRGTHNLFLVIQADQ